MVLASHGDRVSLDKLIDNVWPSDAAPASARKTIQVYVHRLRGALGAAVETVQDGYRLSVDNEQVDERLFGLAVVEARSLMKSNPALASEKFAAALALWHGEPYASFADAPALRPEIVRLSEARLSAWGDRMDCDLALSRHADLAGELESLALTYPLHERFRAQQMLALYRCGRHADALRAFADTRDQMIEELGIEPSASLAALELQVLSNDTDLDCDPVHHAIGAHALRGYELVELVRKNEADEIYLAVQQSVGRRVAIRIIGPELAADPVFMERYWADASTLARLNHPGIVYVQDTWIDDGKVFEVMEWVEGNRLDKLLESSEVSPAMAWKIYKQVSSAVKAAHEAGVVHGAIDPTAVLVTSNEIAYLKDFIGWKESDAEQDLAGLSELAYELHRHARNHGQLDPSLVKLATAAG